MRFRLKKTIKICIFFVVLVVYINFYQVIRSSLSVNNDEKQPQEPQPFPDQLQQFVVRDITTQPRNFDNITVEVIYPSEINQNNDRIREQLKFIPDSITSQLNHGSKPLMKTIFLASGLGGWAIKRGQDTFKEQKCAVQDCIITDTRTKMKEADVVLFNGLSKAVGSRPPNQVWVLYMLESPYHTPNLRVYKSKFNWTATYRHDSTIVAPYEKFVPYNDSVLIKPQPKNYAAGKTKMVAWFVSNCGARNNRKQYALELSKHIQVDIYGHCGSLKCPRHQSGKCFDMLNKDYRFYLAFENSNCRDYITEKFFVNGLEHDVIPIVMGASPEDYKRVAPPHSYIHVDDFASTKEMAGYLNLLASNEKLYNEYFLWKGTGRLINTYFWCRMCALAHDVERRGVSWYENVETWWRGENICIGQKSWRDVKNRTNLIGQFPVYDKVS